MSLYLPENFEVVVRSARTPEEIRAGLLQRETGKDMSSKYKETAMGGLAVNVVEC